MTSRSHTPEDVEKIQSGWRKRQTEETIKFRDAFPREPYVLPVDRNDVLEEVAKEFDKMKIFEADTMASLAVYIRNMKK